MGRLTAEEKKKVQKPLLWIGLASIVMVFAGLTSGYVVSRSALKVDNRWSEFPLPDAFLWATIAIALSSVTFIWAKSAIKKGDQKKAGQVLGLTILLGLAFAGLQLLGWQEMVDAGLYFTGEGSSTSVSWVYVITALHWLHFLSGLISLIYTYIRNSKGAYTAKEYQGLSVSGIYWHFLDGLWLYLYFFLLIIR